MTSAHWASPPGDFSEGVPRSTVAGSFPPSSPLLRVPELPPLVPSGAGLALLFSWPRAPVVFHGVVHRLLAARSVFVGHPPQGHLPSLLMVDGAFFIHLPYRHHRSTDHPLIVLLEHLQPGVEPINGIPLHLFCSFIIRGGRGEDT
ncbi:hypothetical protein EYF80_058116 [Liparis tanakae]|uniref:Uncharacterized protein n=1 Tax=Liparis tanakae TaxID=230148 RepID=A0A4Z2ES23_9TELE|nr:hypothetical protein EYF80_058116 [Liparis tanakae]